MEATVMVWRDVRRNWTAVVKTETPDDFGRVYRRARYFVLKWGGEDAAREFDEVWPDLGSPYGVAATVGKGDGTVMVSLQYMP